LERLEKFRFINKIEGYSFLILLFIAMPLKYIFGLFLATKIIGIIHGGLFTWFIFSLIITFRAKLFTPKETLMFFILSLVPFGTFYTENFIKNKFDTVRAKIM
jgi:integral membrane protein